MRHELHNNTKRTLWDDISIWWRHDGKYYISNIKYGIGNLIFYLPTIWKDRNYDHHYIFEILKVKLKRQSKYILGKDRLQSSSNKSRNMMICADLINKIQEQFYECEYLEYIKTDMYFIDFESPDHSDKNLYEFKSDLISETLDDYFKKYPLMYKKVIKMPKPPIPNTDKDNIARNISILNAHRANTLLFKIMRDEMCKWWD